MILRQFIGAGTFRIEDVFGRGTAVLFRVLAGGAVFGQKNAGWFSSRLLFVELRPAWRSRWWFRQANVLGLVFSFSKGISRQKLGWQRQKLRFLSLEQGRYGFCASLAGWLAQSNVCRFNILAGKRRVGWQRLCKKCNFWAGWVSFRGTAPRLHEGRLFWSLRVLRYPVCLALR